MAQDHAKERERELVELTEKELEGVSAGKGASSGKTNSGATFLKFDFKQVYVTSF
jgi:hypothetical protein